MKCNIADDAGTPHSVAIATTDASIVGDGSGNADLEHLPSTSSTPSQRRLARLCVKSSCSPRMSATVARSSACRQQCCDDSPLAALRVYHDRQRLSRASATSPEIVTSLVDHETRHDDDSFAADATKGSDSDLTCHPEN